MGIGEGNQSRELEERDLLPTGFVDNEMPVPSSLSWKSKSTREQGGQF